MSSGWKHLNGLYGTGIHYSWRLMKTRCRSDRPRYGGRGITYCIRWDKFLNFYEDMGATWRPGLQLDRIDNDGNYEPSNCRWATKKEQANNRITNHLVTIDGVTDTITNWAEQVGINRMTIYNRINRYNWEPAKAILTPVRGA